MSNFGFPIIDSNECVGNSLSTINLNFVNTSSFLGSLETKIANVSAHSYSTVQQISAGSNITISPVQGTGIVVINANVDDEMSTHSQFITGAQNIGSLNAGVGIYKETQNQALRFKKLISGGTNIVIQEDGDNIKFIAYDKLGGPGGESNTLINAGNGVGLAMPKLGTSLPIKTLIAGPNVTLTTSTSSVTISSSVTDGQNIGNGLSLFSGIQNSKMSFRTLTAATPNLSIQYGGNSNSEIRLSVTETTSAENLGNLTLQGTASLFKRKQGSLLGFKTIRGDSQTTNTDPSNSPCTVTLRDDNLGNTVLVKVSDNIQGVNKGTGTKLFIDKTESNLNFKTIKAGSNNLSITESTDTITLDARGLQGGEINTATNVGGGFGVYKAKTGFNLEFKTLVPGPGINISETSNTILISATPPEVGQGDIKNASNLGVGSGLFSRKTGSTLEFKSLSAIGPSLLLSETPGTNTLTLRVQNVILNGTNHSSSNASRIFKEKEDSNLIFRRLKAGNGINIYEGGLDDSEIIISATGTSGSVTPVQTTKEGGSFKNKIINGNFSVWQWQRRATQDISGTVTYQNVEALSDSDNSTVTQFLADRMGFYSGKALTGGLGTQTATFSSVSLPYNETHIIPTRPTRCGRIILGARATGSTTPTQLVHRIENVSMLAGKQVALSFWARSNNVGSSQVEIGFGQFYKASIPQMIGPDGTFKSVATLSTSTDWQPLSTTFTFPSINSTLWQNAWGTDSKNSLFDSFSQLVISIPGSIGRFVDFSSIQLEEGSTPTAFENRPQQVELALCQRYFETGDTLRTAIAVNTLTNITDTAFKVTKRIAPAMRTDNRSVLLTAYTSGISQHAFLDTRIDGFRTQYAAATNLTNTSPFIYNWSASAEF